MHGIFHLTAPKREPNYNAVVERSSAVMENMAFAMIHHAHKPKSWWDYAFDWAAYVLDRCPRRSNAQSITPFEAMLWFIHRIISTWNQEHSGVLLWESMKNEEVLELC